jgi:DNA-binding HxlR family transcriptional regulator
MTTTAPAALAWSADNCTVGRTLAILGDRWSFLVCREIFNGIRRFEDMRVRTAIPKQVLTDRLRQLVDNDILLKVPYQLPGERARNEYRLTDKGFALYPILVAIAEWGDQYVADPEGPPVEFVHRDCGAQVHATLTCAAGHAVGDHRNVVTRPGPGARPLNG